jgi:Protein of unknown function (DUF4242)
VPLFAIRREFDPAMTALERETVQASTIAASTFFPHVRWIRSYVVDRPGCLQTFCIYEGPSAESIAQHSTHCRIPCSEIRPVAEVLPGAFIAAADNAVPAGARLFLIRRQHPASVLDDELGGTATRAATSLASMPGVGWVRSFWDAGRKQGWCAYLATAPSIIEEHAAQSRIPCDEITEVVENLPSQWAQVYDGFGLPRHWEPDAPQLVGAGE